MKRFKAEHAYLAFMILILSVFLITGCGSSGGNGQPGLCLRNPTVTLTAPADAAAGILTNTTITVTFSKAMDPATLTETTFTLTGPDATPVSGTVISAGATATFTPVGDLARNTTYTATITTGAKDLAGNALASNYIWDFQTTTIVAHFTINEDSSPVFSTLIPDQAYVIKDNVNYKLYYAGNDFASINLATSPDGITWTPYSGNSIISDPLQQEHADVHFYSAGFIGANSGTNPSTLTMNYRMWYQGPGGHSIAGWRYSESPDGINWYNHMAVNQFGTPVLDINISAQYGIADAVYTPGASNTGTDWTFRIYVNAQYAVSPYSSNELVVMAFSADGYNWTGYDPTSAGYATPVFAPTLDGTSFDCDHIGWFKVIKNSPTDWEAFYSGGKGTTYQALNGIGYATSDDGINWTRRQTLLTTSDGVAWRSQSVWMPSVFKTGSNYEIYFLGSDNPNIGSSDWIQWKIGRAILTP